MSSDLTFITNEQGQHLADRFGFPEDFMFQLTVEEAESLRFRFGSSKRGQHYKYLQSEEVAPIMNPRQAQGLYIKVDVASLWNLK